METWQNVLTRRSAPRLTDPVPADGELLTLVEAAMTAPDHGRLQPWRLITLRGDERVALGRRMAACAGDDPAVQERAAAKPLRAPLLIAIVFAPVEHAKIPRWEQLAATVAAVHTVQLLLHDRGYSSIWRSGKVTEEDEVRALHGLAPTEQLLGWLYTGTAAGPVPPRPRLNPRPRLRSLSHPAPLSA